MTNTNLQINKDLNIVPFVSVDHMMKIIGKLGMENMLEGIASYVEEDFKRWQLFDKTPRVAAHSNEGVIEFGKLQLELLHQLDHEGMERVEAQYEVERFWVGALKDAVIDGDVKRGSLLAGQSVGLVDKVQPLQEIVDEMVADAEKEMQRLHSIFNNFSC